MPSNLVRGGDSAMQMNPLGSSISKQQQPAGGGIYTPYDATAMHNALGNLHKFRPASQDTVPPQVPVPPTGSHTPQVMQPNPISTQQPSVPSGTAVPSGPTPVPTNPTDSVLILSHPSTPAASRPQAQFTPPANLPQNMPTTPIMPGQQQQNPNHGTSPVSTGGSGSAAAALDAELQGGLDRTNQYRQQHQAAALQWDASLAAQASAFIARCPRGHSNTPQVGENLAWGFSSLTDAIDAW
jgi:uncharacterized protein YkwD